MIDILERQEEEFKMERKVQGTVRMTVVAAMITALTIAMGLVPGIPMILVPVPIILQNIGVMFAGEVLGAKYGTLSVAVFLLLASLGFPVLSGGHGGAAVFVGPTGGYLVAWLLAPMVINLVKKFLPSKINSGWIGSLVSVWLGGAVFMDLFGAFWLSIFFHVPFVTAMVSSLMFIPGDTIKAILTALVAKRLKKIVHLK